MKVVIPIHLVTEDDLSEAVLRRVLRDRNHHTQYECRTPFQHSGFGQLRRNVRAFNAMSRACPVLLLTDLDRFPCPPAMVREWLPSERNSEFLFRIAVREVEAWLLGSPRELNAFLQLRYSWNNPDPEGISDPKEILLQLAEDSPFRHLREAVVQVDRHGRRRQEPAYNSVLSEFVGSTWNWKSASDRCPSLRGLLDKLESLERRRQ